MIPLTLSEVATVTGGVVHDDPAGAQVTGPAFIDSRQPWPGGLFVALVGERTDGHTHAESALGLGAAAVLGSRPTGVPTVVVDDPVRALGQLARHVADVLVADHGLTILALTGSQGKTGTKDYLAHLLATTAPTVSTAGNLNNEIGVPLTVLRASAETRFLVVEMGARGLEHIAYLCTIAPPRIAGLLNVGTAHLGAFGSREAIARAKGEIVEALGPEGTAVTNGDDAGLVAAVRARTRAPVLTFGRAAGVDVHVGEVTDDDLGRPTATFTASGVVRRVALPQVGRHQVANAAAAAAMAIAAGLPPAEVLETLGTPGASSPWRMETTELADGTVVINDAYNANPDSMRAALDTLAAIGARRSARTVAVLGEMRELGDEAEAEHLGVGAHAAGLGVDVLVAVGEAGASIGQGARAVAGWSGEVILTSTGAGAAAAVRENVAPGDVVLVKASRGVALEHVASALTDTAGDDNQGGREHR